MADLPQEVLDYLGDHKTLTLATCGGDGPWAATLTYVNDGPDLYVWMRPNSTTVRHIDNNPTAAFTIDEYSENWRETKGIQGRGNCLVLQGQQIARAANLFGEKYPQLRPGSTSAVIFFRIEPEALEFIDNSPGVDEEGAFGADYRRQSVLDMPALDEERTS